MTIQEKGLLISRKVTALHCLKCYLLLASLSQFSYPQAIALKTGYAYHPRCTTYVQSAGHPESPERVKWIHNRLTETNVLQQVSPVVKLEDPMPHILKVHTESHVQGIHAIPLKTAATEKIGPIADLAAALVLGAVESVCAGRMKNAFCNIRPPGHHVVNGGHTSGFCAYANVVIAARFAQEVMNHQRVLIIDWDYHHGNGTVHFVCNDSNVLFFEVGCEGCGVGDCNKEQIHIITKGMEGETDNQEYISVWEKHLLPAAEAFKPQLVLISSGFDLKKHDGLGSYNVTAHGISRLTRMAMDIAEKHCNGKLVSMLEGGYYDRNTPSDSWYGLSQFAENHVKTLISGTVQPETPFYQLSSVTGKKAAAALRPGVPWVVTPWLENLPPGTRVFDFRGKAKILVPESSGVPYIKLNR